MEALITSRYNDGILQEAMRRFDIAPDAIESLGGFESYVYAFSRADGEFILRISHSQRRTAALIQGEVDWINHLARGGAGVARAILSAQGNLVEAIDDGHGGQFLATAFVKAQGESVYDTGWSDQLFENYGRLMGRIHQLTKSYQPADPAWQRQHWDDPANLEIARWIPDQPAVIAKFDALMTHIAALPRDTDTYGMIHQDAHPGNFFVTADGQITLFDFDDCVYGPFIYDIAMVVLYYVLLEDDPDGLVRAFWPHFWRGYCMENQLDVQWLAEIPAFMKLREIDLYALLHRSLAHPETDGGDWVRAFCKDRKAMILNDVPLVTVDFRALVEA